MAAPVSTQTTPEARVLVVDDETNIVELLSVSLKFQGFEVYTADNGPAALDRAREIKPDAVILDPLLTLGLPMLAFAGLSLAGSTLRGNNLLMIILLMACIGYYGPNAWLSGSLPA